MPTADSPVIAPPAVSPASLTCPKCSFLNTHASGYCQQCGGEVGVSLGRRSKVRWIILSLVFLGTTVNYLDRQVLGMLAKELDDKYHINNAAFGEIAACFSVAYALGQLGAGGWLDKVGARLGYAIALGAWSVSSILHALVTSVLGFKIVRILLGVSESPAYPGATKVLAEWFPRRERALAMGWVNGGSNVGLLLAAAVVPIVTARYGIPSAFIFTGAAGLVFLVLWLLVYRTPEQHPGVSPAELAYIRCDPVESTSKIPWLSLLAYRQTWSFVAPKFITDAMWGFLTFFGAKFLAVRFNLDIKHIGLPMIVVYLLADLGSIGGGWLSSWMIHRGWSVNAARKLTMLICAICVMPVAAAPYVNSLYVAATLVGIALAAHQGFSSNQYTLISDMFPRRVVASVAGMGGCIGYFGGALLQWLGGMHLQSNGGNYQGLFAIVACAYIVALAMIHGLAPTMQRATISEPRGFDVLPPKE